MHMKSRGKTETLLIRPQGAEIDEQDEGINSCQEIKQSKTHEAEDSTRSGRQKTSRKESQN